MSRICPIYIRFSFLGREDILFSVCTNTRSKSLYLCSNSLYVLYDPREWEPSQMTTLYKYSFMVRHLWPYSRGSSSCQFWPAFGAVLIHLFPRDLSSMPVFIIYPPDRYQKPFVPKMQSSNRFSLSRLSMRKPSQTLPDWSTYVGRHRTMLTLSSPCPTGYSREEAWSMGQAIRIISR